LADQLDRALLMTPLHRHRDWWIRSNSSPVLLSLPPYLLRSSCTKLEPDILRRKLFTPKNTSDSQPTLHALNDNRISHCGAYVVTGDHPLRGALPRIVDLRFLSFRPIRSTLISRSSGTVHILNRPTTHEAAPRSLIHPHGILVRKTRGTE
jgi:hypothetical protein